MKALGIILIIMIPLAITLFFVDLAIKSCEEDVCVVTESNGSITIGFTSNYYDPNVLVKMYRDDGNDTMEIIWEGYMSESELDAMTGKSQISTFGFDHFWEGRK